MSFKIVPRLEDEGLYARSSAARIAGVSVEFFVRCEQEELIVARVASGVEPSYSLEDIWEVMRINRLYRDLDLELSAIGVVLHLRRQILDLQNRLAQLEQEARLREQDLLAEIQDLLHSRATQLDEDA